jgi:hypothetical protein
MPEAAKQQGNRACFACGQHANARGIGLDAAGELNQSRAQPEKFIDAHGDSPSKGRRIMPNSGTDFRNGKAKSVTSVFLCSQRPMKQQHKCCA